MGNFSFIGSLFSFYSDEKFDFDYINILETRLLIIARKTFDTIKPTTSRKLS